MKRTFLVFAMLFLLMVPLWSQNGTPHGITWSATAGTCTGSGCDPNAVIGFNLYQGVGSTVCGASPVGPLTKQNISLLTTPAFLSPSSGLATSSLYCAYMTAVDSVGSESAASNLATVTTPATWPVNPPPPTGCKGAVQ